MYFGWVGVYFVKVGVYFVIVGAYAGEFDLIIIIFFM